MSLFRCPKCGVIENTALADLGSQVDAHLSNSHVCSQCLTGKWHDQFPREVIPSGVCPGCKQIIGGWFVKDQHTVGCPHRRLGYVQPYLWYLHCNVCHWRGEDMAAMKPKCPRCDGAMNIHNYGASVCCPEPTESKMEDQR